MTRPYFRKQRPVVYPPGPPSGDTLPWGTLDWTDDTEAEQWASAAVLLGADQEAVRRNRDGLRVTGLLLARTVTWTDDGPRKAARVLWQVDGQDWRGRVFGSLRGAYGFWKRFMDNTQGVS